MASEVAMAKRFVEQIEQAQFNVGGGRHFKIVLEMPGVWHTEISDDGGATFLPIMDGEDVIFYGSFGEAFSAVVEQNWEM